MANRVALASDARTFVAPGDHIVAANGYCGTQYLRDGFDRAFHGSVHPRARGATLRVVRLRSFLGRLETPLATFAAAHERAVRGRAATLRGTPFLGWAEAGAS